MKGSVLIALASAVAVSALPNPNNGNSNSNGNNGHKGTPHTPQCHGSTRPNVKPHPYHPKNPGPSIGHRNGKQCIVQTYGDGSDDSTLVMTALKNCNNGGHVVFAPNTTYTVGTALDLTFLKHIDLDVQGTIQFTNDTDYWQANSFPFVFQNVTSFFRLGGEDVAMYGGGTLDGNGQVWYDLYAKDSLILRPVLIGIDGLHDSTISNLVLRYSPMYYHFVANSTNVVFDSINIAGSSKSSNVAKNTDGWDTYRSSDITIQNSVIVNGDDCVSFKPNSSNIVVQGLSCTGSHGISVGSLGQYPGEYDIVENIFVSDIQMSDASDGARIKVWPNAPSSMSVDLQGGGGNGRVSNVTYQNLVLSNVDYAIEVTSCYGQKNLTLCLEYPSPIVIEDVRFLNFTGTTSTKYEPYMATLQCSSTAVCSNITAVNIDVHTPKGSHEATCLNVDEAVLDVTCVDLKA